MIDLMDRMTQLNWGTVGAWSEFMSIKDPIRLARRARAYVSLVGKPYVNETTFTSEFALIANQLWKAGFDGQQIHDIAQTRANIPVLMLP